MQPPWKCVRSAFWKRGCGLLEACGCGLFLAVCCAEKLKNHFTREDFANKRKRKKILIIIVIISPCLYFLHGHGLSGSLTQAVAPFSVKTPFSGAQGEKSYFSGRVV